MLDMHGVDGSSPLLPTKPRTQPSIHFLVLIAAFFLFKGPISCEILFFGDEDYEIQLIGVDFVLSLRLFLYGFRYICNRYQCKKPYQQAVCTCNGFNGDLGIRIFYFNFSTYGGSKHILGMSLRFRLGSFLQYYAPLCTYSHKNRNSIQ